MSIHSRDFFLKLGHCEKAKQFKKYILLVWTVTVNVKTNGKILKAFLAFSKKLNFKKLAHSRVTKAVRNWILRQNPAETFRRGRG